MAKAASSSGSRLTGSESTVQCGPEELTLNDMRAKQMFAWADANRYRFPYPHGCDRSEFWQEVRGELGLKMARLFEAQEKERQEEGSWKTGYLYTVIRNIAIDLIRQRKRRPTISLDAETEGRPALAINLEDGYVDGVDAKRFVEELSQFSSANGHHGEVVRLKGQGFDAAAIAKTLGVTRNAVYLRWERAKRHLRQNRSNLLPS